MNRRITRVLLFSAMSKRKKRKCRAQACSEHIFNANLYPSITVTKTNELPQRRVGKTAWLNVDDTADLCSEVVNHHFFG